jgi:hypothetical protein
MSPQYVCPYCGRDINTHGVAERCPDAPTETGGCISLLGCLVTIAAFVVVLWWIVR